jgi:hypothetical protein
MATAVDHKLVSSLMRRVRAYEKYFRRQEKSGDDPDNQAHAAYMNLVKLVHSLAPPGEDGETPPSKAEKVREVLRDVYGIEG